MTKAAPPSSRAHPVLRFAYLHMKVENISMKEVALKSGISYSHMKRAMSGKADISLLSMEAILNVLGYSLKATTARVV